MAGGRSVIPADSQSGRSRQKEAFAEGRERKGVKGVEVGDRARGWKDGDHVMLNKAVWIISILFRPQSRLKLMK